MAGDELQRKPRIRRSATAFPGRNVAVHRRTVRILRLETLERLRYEFESTRLRRQAAAELVRILAGQGNGLRDILRLPLREPPHIDRRLRRRCTRRDHVIPFLEEIPPADYTGQIRRVKDSLAPVEFGAAAFGEQGAQ